MSVSRPIPRAYLGAEESVPRGVVGGQFVADSPDDEIVVFLIGMRINRWRRVRSWWPAFMAMPRMLAELKRTDHGLLGARIYWSGRTIMVVQYWRSAAELGAYARDTSLSHAPAWAAFNKKGASAGDAGLFHETYVVPKAGIESLYANMPVFGLAQATGWTHRQASTPRTKAHEDMRSTRPDYVEPA